MIDEIEVIIDREVYSGKVFYEVKWKGADETTWESIKALKSRPHSKSKNKCDGASSKKSGGVRPFGAKKRGRPPSKVRVSKKLNKIGKNELYFESEESKREVSCQQNLNMQIDLFEENSSNEVNEVKQISTEASQDSAQCMPKEENMTEVSVKTDITSEPKVKEEKQIKDIYCIGKTSGNKMTYVAEFTDGSLLKCDKEELKEKYLREFIKFQEHYLINKLSKA